MPERPLVSIITATQNSVKHLPRCIASVLGQSYERIEHVVVDCASTDGTVEYLKTQPASVRWLSEPLDGVGEALNQALSMAKGDIICWLDADDDLFATNSVELVVEAMLERSELDVAFGKVLLCQDERGLQSLGIPSLEMSLSALMRAPDATKLYQSAMFMRRRVFEWLGPYASELSTGRDFEHWLRMAATGFNFGYLDQILARTSPRSPRHTGIAAQIIRQQISFRYLHHLDRPQRVAFWKDYYVSVAQTPEFSGEALQTTDVTELIGRQLARKSLGLELEMSLLAQHVDRHRTDSDLLYMMGEAFVQAGHGSLGQKIYDYADRMAVLPRPQPTEAASVMVPTWDLDELQHVLRDFFASVADARPRFLRMLVEPKSNVPAHVARFHVAEVVQSIGRSPDAGDCIELIIANVEDIHGPIGEQLLVLRGQAVPPHLQHLVGSAPRAVTEPAVARSDAPPDSAVVLTVSGHEPAPVVPIRSMDSGISERGDEDSRQHRPARAERLRALG